MFDLTYVREDFHQLKLYSMNSEQLFTLLQSKNFLETAPKEKVIECLKHVQKDRKVKLYKERAEVMEAVKSIALNHKMMARIKKQSYVTSFVHAVSRMRIDDEEVWGSLAAYLA